MPKLCHIEVFKDKWEKVLFTEGNTKSYCDGYVDAMDTLYPSPRYRIIRDGCVIRETVGHSRLRVSSITGDRKSQP
jgi:hypothetical protein